MPSTKLAIFLNVESYFNIETNFTTDMYQKTASGMTRGEFINTLIRKYFQNFMTVNALDAYRAGVMPVYSIVSSTKLQDEDTMVAEGSIILQIIRKAAQLNSDTVTETIPQFTLTRVYASVQDRLEAKSAFLLNLLQNVDITREATL